MVARAVAELGALDVLYHCAVDVHFVNHQDTRLTELDDDVWQRMLDLCLTGDLPRLQARRPADARAARGSIVLTATTDALIGVAGLDAYTAAKGGVVALTRSFAAGMAPDGVRVNAVCPAFVATEPQMPWLDDPAARARSRACTCCRSRAGGGRAVRGLPGLRRVAAMTGGVHPVDAGYMAFKARVDVMGAMQAGQPNDEES